MRILLDECLDWRLGRELPGHEVESVPQRGWAGIGVFITVDRNLAYQQHTATLPMVVVVLAASSVKRRDLRPLMPKVLAALAGDLTARLIVIRP